MKIRKATKKDLKDFLRLKKESIRDYSRFKRRIKVTNNDIKKEFENILSSKKRFLFVVEEEKKIFAYFVGTLIINPYQKTGDIDDIFVLKKFRRKGIGTLLIRKFIHLLQNRTINRIRLGVNIKNKKALALYKKLGFKIYRYEMEKNLK